MNRLYELRLGSPGIDPYGLRSPADPGLAALVGGAGITGLAKILVVWPRSCDENCSNVHLRRLGDPQRPIASPEVPYRDNA